MFIGLHLISSLVWTYISYGSIHFAATTVSYIQLIWQVPAAGLFLFPCKGKFNFLKTDKKCQEEICQI